MIPFTVQVTFSPEIMANLRAMTSRMEDAHKVMLDVVETVTRDMKQTAYINSPVDDTPQADNIQMKAMWSDVYQVNGGFAFGNSAPYAYVLEYGLYPGIGKRTVAGHYAGKDTGWNSYGVFSSQAVGGMLGILETQGVVDGAANSIINEMLNYFQNGF